MKYLAILFISSVTLACAAPQGASQTAAASSQTCAQADGQAVMGPGMMGHGGGSGMMGPGMMGHGGGSGMMMGAGMAQNCPMAMEGVTMRSEETPGGASIVFSTSGDATELRRRVAAMVDMHDKHQGSCAMMASHDTATTSAPEGSTAAPVDHAAHHPKTDAKAAAPH